MRIAIAPIVWGEQVVIRLLDKSGTSLKLEDMGYTGRALRTIRKGLEQPNGMILTSGPTGSGKSTSLYALIQEIKNDAINIVTLEDPVEYKMEGINQIQVNPEVGLTFATGLRSILRQDPDVVMVGEIRDKETAQLAVQAALTGHLVFSTLHTSSAAGILPRLLDMGVEPFLIASTVRVVVAQRLVRRLCVDCREVVTPDAATLKQLVKAFNLDDNGGFKQIHELETLALQDGIGKSGSGKNAGTDKLSTTTASIDRLWKAHDDGCESCNHSGYKGRIGIYEVLGNSTAIQKMIVSGSTSEAIEQTAISENMLTMQLDGLIKSLRGQTTIEEVLRVTSQA